MRIPRLFLDAPLSVGLHLELPAEQANYLTRVLRLRPGAELRVFNGLGLNGQTGTFHAQLIQDKPARIVVAQFIPSQTESPLKTHLLQGVSRGERMEYTIQKAVELGINRITPIHTQRSMVSLDGERAERRLQRWIEIARSACEQCQRDIPPRIDPIIKLSQALVLPREENELALTLDPEAVHPLTRVPARPRAVRLLIGPEGGLDENEITAARAAGFEGVRLGPRVLRTETAGVVALTVVQTLWGDLATGSTETGSGTL